MSDWKNTFNKFTRYLRECGWRQPIILRGRRVMVVGVASPRQLARIHYNDNRRPR